MPSTTTNYGLHIFNLTTNKAETFEDFRDLIAGIGTNSNMYIIDGKLKEWKDLIDDLENRQAIIRVPMTSDNSPTNTQYSATGIAGISVSYPTGMTIVVIPNEDNGGTTQLNINSLGNLTLVKYDTTGTVANLAAGDLVANHSYLFIYDGTNLVWVTPNTLDQIHAPGTAGNFIGISTENVLEDTGISLDTDITLASDSDSKIPSQKAVKAYVDNLIPSLDGIVYKGVIDCSANPNYPAADAGWLYFISVAGKIGGASGVNVEVGDLIICKVDGSASGNQATVGANWNVVQGNIDGAVVNTGTSTNNAISVFDGTTGKVIKDGAAPGVSGNVLISDGTSWTSSIFTTILQNFLLSGDISPSQITSNQNDYNPTGLSTATVIRLSTDASRDITGIQGGADGRILILSNVGSNNIVLKNQDSNSTASNRFIFTSDVTLQANQAVMIQYDSTTSRWRLLGGTGAGGAVSSNRSWFGV